MSPFPQKNLTEVLQDMKSLGHRKDLFRWKTLLKNPDTEKQELPLTQVPKLNMEPENDSFQKSSPFATIFRFCRGVTKQKHQQKNMHIQWTDVLTPPETNSSRLKIGWLGADPSQKRGKQGPNLQAGYLKLGGGFKYFFFSSLFGEMIQFD